MKNLLVSLVGAGLLGSVAYSVATYFALDLGATFAFLLAVLLIESRL